MAEKLASSISKLLNHLKGCYIADVIFRGLHQPKEQLISSRQIKSPKPRCVFRFFRLMLEANFFWHDNGERIFSSSLD